MCDPNYTNIGNRTLIQERHDYPIGLEGHKGNLGDYVPFYFGGISVMLYNIKTGYRGIPKIPESDIVYICCKLDSFVEKGLDFVFTDGHAKNSTTRFFDDLSDLNKVDWNLVKARYWGNTDEDNDRKRKKQAEFLVKSHVPPDCISMIGVFDQEKCDLITQIVQESGLEIPVRIDTQKKLYYYS